MTELALPEPVVSEDPPGVMVVDPLYIVQRDFRQNVNGVTLSFRQGQVIRDPQKIIDLKAQRAPIEVVRDEEDLVVCPHCTMSFRLSVVRGAQSLLERAQALMGGRV